jgi:hypothetical protein
MAGGVALWRGSAVDSVMRACRQSSPVRCSTVARVVSSRVVASPRTRAS